MIIGSREVVLEMKKDLGHSEKKILNKHIQGANSELNSLYFPRKTPRIQKSGRILKNSSECYGPSSSSSNSCHSQHPGHGESEAPKRCLFSVGDSLPSRSWRKILCMTTAAMPADYSPKPVRPVSDKEFQCYDWPDQLQKHQTPDLETAENLNSRKRCRVSPGQSARKTAEKQPDGHPNSRKTAVLHVLGVFQAVFRLFPRHSARGPPGTFFGCFLAVFKVRRLGPL